MSPVERDKTLSELSGRINVLREKYQRATDIHAKHRLYSIIDTLEREKLALDLELA